MFPKDYLLVTYSEHESENENQTWILEFLASMEQKLKLLKMKEIIAGTLDEEKYEINFQHIHFENEFYYNGFIDAKTKHFENTMSKVISYKKFYCFLGLITMGLLPKEKLLLDLINKTFKTQFIDLLQIDETLIMYDYINLNKIFYKTFTTL
jgi:hypothetical protein